MILKFKNISNSFDDSDDIRSMEQLQKEVRAIQDVSTGATTDVVRYYGLTFHEVIGRKYTHKNYFPFV
jgi:hypothetical protein